jgi:hypothetical protein
MDRAHGNLDLDMTQAQVLKNHRLGWSIQSVALWTVEYVLININIFRITDASTFPLFNRRVIDTFRLGGKRPMQKWADDPMSFTRFVAGTTNHKLCA